jgi:ABC-type polysaccharide/polyol phosphate transport system ATPase subunit
MTAVQFESVSKVFKANFHRPRSFHELVTSLGRRHTVREESFWVLRDVSFAIAPGETVGLIGENGAGKSTALKLMARTILPTSGTVSLNGKVSALLELGAGFHPDLSGRENIFLSGSLMGLSRAYLQARFDEIVAFSELETFINMPVKHYSSGMYMRLAFAVSAHIDPDILLVDEVLAVGDQAYQAKCLRRISQLQERGVTIFIVSHDLGTIARLCQRVMWLDDGRVCGDGPPDDVIPDYVSQRGGGRDGWHVSEGAVKQVSRRWGSGEVHIEGFELLDHNDQPSQVFTTGERMTIRMWYYAPERIQDPAFGFGIHAADGAFVTSPNCVEDGQAASVEGRGHVDYIFEALPLLTGTYDLTVAVYNRHVTLPYDHWHKAGRFMVRDKFMRQRDGLVLLPGRWIVN